MSGDFCKKAAANDLPSAAGVSSVDKKDAAPGVKQNREPAQYPQGTGRQQEILS